jgi:hypothetical protein
VDLLHPFPNFGLCYTLSGALRFDHGGSVVLYLWYPLDSFLVFARVVYCLLRVDPNDGNWVTTSDPILVVRRAVLVKCCITSKTAAQEEKEQV